jgi:hypothetical protein
VLLGCGPKPTTVLVDIQAAPGLTVSSLVAEIDIDGRPVRTSAPVDATALPGSMLVRTADRVALVTVRLSGQDALGNVVSDEKSIETTPHQEVTLSMMLGDPGAAMPDMAVDDTDGGGAGVDLLGGGGDLAQQPDMTAVGNVCMQSGAATACAGKGYLFCDGFESASGSSFPGWITVVINGGASGTTSNVVTTPTCRGTKAFEAVGKGGGQEVWLAGGLTLPSTVHIRSFVYVPPTSDWPTMSYTNLMSVYDGSTLHSVAVRFSDTAGKLYINRNFDSQSNLPSVGPFATGRWVCVELAVQSANSGGRATLSIDGKVVGDYTNIDTLANGDAYDHFGVGLDTTEAGTTGTADVFFDEVVVSNSAIGCN